MTSIDVGLDFWLRYVEASGGLIESSGDTALVMLPPTLQATLELPEELRVTTDPDVAREDGATLLSAGHPALGRSAEAVLAVGDVAAMAVEVAPTLPPSAEHLQAIARDHFAVDHGRIDATGTPTRSMRSILRVGALVDYTLSSDDHYQECAECWVDVRSHRPLPAQVSTKLATLPIAHTEISPALTGLTAAIRCADEVIEHVAQRRRSELGDDIGRARDAELERVEAYYRDALATIERRQTQAPPDRRELLVARAESVRSEHARRVVETREKYRASHQVRPYRLHLYEVPAWRLPVDVRRGDRRYRLTLEWLIPLSRFADIACPHCGADERLVATKARLGCTSCVPSPIVQIAPEPSKPRAKPAAAKPDQVTTPRPTGSRRASPVCAQPSPAPVRTHKRVDKSVEKSADKLVGKLWEAVVGNDRRVVRLCAPDSPAAAAVQLYGPSGAACAIGIPPAEGLAAVTRTTTASFGARHASNGYVETTAGHRFSFLLRWQTAAGPGEIDEILPYDRPYVPARLAPWILGPAREAVHSPPQHRIPLGSVGELLWRRVTPTFGLPCVLRCLAALWRLRDEEFILSSHGPLAVAAAIERTVCQRANLTKGRFADIAVAYRIEAAAVRAADAELQKNLRLGPETWW